MRMMCGLCRGYFFTADGKGRRRSTSDKLSRAKRPDSPFESEYYKAVYVHIISVLGKHRLISMVTKCSVLCFHDRTALAGLRV